MPLYRWEIIRRRKPLITRKLHDVSQVLYLPFDLDDGSYARDRSGYSNHGTIYGPTRVAGKIGGALDFDGVDDYVDLGNPPSLRITGALTLAAWIKTTRYENWPRIISKDNGVDLRSYILILRKDGCPRFSIWVGGVETMTDGATFVGDGKWHHLAGVNDMTDTYIYVDGELDGKVEGGGGPVDDTLVDVWLGAITGGGSWFEGIIDEVRIYSRALSQSEIKRLMNLRGV